MPRKRAPEAISEDEAVGRPELDEAPRIQPVPEPEPRRDIVVAGASAGGVRAFRDLVANLPRDLPASIFFVLHVSPEFPSFLPDVLSMAGPLPAVHPSDGDPIRHGRIYVAPPDMHLLVERARVRVVHGPRENRHRPALDPLFRSAAMAYGERVVGIVLTGVLNDGSAGLAAIKSRGGITVVQDPEEATFSAMPRNALKRLPVDHVLKVRAIATLINRLSREPIPRKEERPVSENMEKETRVAYLDPAVLDTEKKPGRPSAFSCPECHGVLWEINEGEMVRYRCRVGHAYSAESLAEAQGESVERALWSALRVLEERISFLKRLKEDASHRGVSTLADHFEEKRAEAERNAGFVRDALLRNPKE
ncbi:MAG TPA: chemotaxis protein CheB [Thermoanaerobaculia bacterium]|nr:chemotaxis protein CheB [Thermoanaerobaculia bacterium]